MTRLLLVAWNCAGGFRTKTHVVSRLRPDIAVISETGRDAVGCCEGTTSAVSIGTENGRGLTILGFNGWRIEPSGLRVEERLFLPVYARRGEVSVQLVGMCVKRDKSYVAPTLSALQQLRPFLSASPTLLAGDFNQSAVFDAKRGAGRRFSDTVKALEALGLRSAWHDHRRENFGAESAPSYFDRRTDTQWHIDYAFVPSEMEVIATELGSFDDIATKKLSDHAPLSVTLAVGVRQAQIAPKAASADHAHVIHSTKSLD